MQRARELIDAVHAGIRVKQLWAEYLRVSQLENRRETIARLGEYLDSFRDAYGSRPLGSSFSWDRLSGNTSAIFSLIVDVVDQQEAERDDPQLVQSLLELVDKALSVAELLLREERYLKLVQESPELVDRLVSLLDRLRDPESKRMVVRVLGQASGAAETKVQIGKQLGFGKLMRLLIDEKDDALRHEILQTVQHLLDVDDDGGFGEDMVDGSDQDVADDNDDVAAASSAAKTPPQPPQRVTRRRDGDAAVVGPAAGGAGSGRPPTAPRASAGKGGLASMVLGALSKVFLPATAAGGEARRARQPRVARVDNDEFPPSRTALARVSAAASAAAASAAVSAPSSPLGATSTSTTTATATATATIPSAVSAPAAALPRPEVAGTSAAATATAAGGSGGGDDSINDDQLVRDLMCVQGALTSLTTSIKEAAATVQLEAIETLCKLLFKSPRTQAEFKEINGYTLLMGVLESVREHASLETQLRIQDHFNVLYILAQDGDPRGLVRNPEPLRVALDVTRRSFHAQVRMQALRCVKDLLAAQPLNAVHVIAAGGVDILLEAAVLASHSGDGDGDGACATPPPAELRFMLAVIDVLALLAFLTTRRDQRVLQRLLQELGRTPPRRFVLRAMLSRAVAGIVASATSMDALDAAEAGACVACIAQHLARLPSLQLAERDAGDAAAALPPIVLDHQVLEPWVEAANCVETVSVLLNAPRSAAAAAVWHQHHGWDLLAAMLSQESLPCAPALTALILWLALQAEQVSWLTSLLAATCPPTLAYHAAGTLAHLLRRAPALRLIFGQADGLSLALDLVRRACVDDGAVIAPSLVDMVAHLLAEAVTSCEQNKAALASLTPLMQLPAQLHHASVVMSRSVWALILELAVCGNMRRLLLPHLALPPAIRLPCDALSDVQRRISAAQQPQPLLRHRLRSTRDAEAVGLSEDHGPAGPAAAAAAATRTAASTASADTATPPTLAQPGKGSPAVADNAAAVVALTSDRDRDDSGTHNANVSTGSNHNSSSNVLSSGNAGPSTSNAPAPTTLRYGARSLRVRSTMQIDFAFTPFHPLPDTPGIQHGVGGGLFAATDEQFNPGSGTAATPSSVRASRGNSPSVRGRDTLSQSSSSPMLGGPAAGTASVVTTASQASVDTSASKASGTVSSLGAMIGGGVGGVGGVGGGGGGSGGGGGTTAGAASVSSALVSESMHGDLAMMFFYLPLRSADAAVMVLNALFLSSREVLLAVLPVLLVLVSCNPASQRLLAAVDGVQIATRLSLRVAASSRRLSNMLLRLAAILAAYSLPAEHLRALLYMVYESPLPGSDSATVIATTMGPVAKRAGQAHAGSALSVSSPTSAGRSLLHQASESPLRSARGPGPAPGDVLASPGSATSSATAHAPLTPVSRQPAAASAMQRVGAGASASMPVLPATRRPSGLTVDCSSAGAGVHGDTPLSRFAHQPDTPWCSKSMAASEFYQAFVEPMQRRPAASTTSAEATGEDDSPDASSVDRSSGMQRRQAWRSDDDEEDDEDDEDDDDDDDDDDNDHDDDGDGRVEAESGNSTASSTPAERQFHSRVAGLAHAAMQTLAPSLPAVVLDATPSRQSSRFAAWQANVLSAMSLVAACDGPPSVFSLNGKNAWVALPPLPPLGGAAKGYTIAMWLRPSAFLGSECGLLTWRDESKESNVVLEVLLRERVRNDVSAQCICFRSGQGKVERTEAVFENQVLRDADPSWHLLVITHHSVHRKHRVRVFIDGVSAGVAEAPYPRVPATGKLVGEAGRLSTSPVHVHPETGAVVSNAAVQAARGTQLFCGQIGAIYVFDGPWDEALAERAYRAGACVPDIASAVDVDQRRVLLRACPSSVAPPDAPMPAEPRDQSSDSPSSLSSPLPLRAPERGVGPGAGSVSPLQRPHRSPSSPVLFRPAPTSSPDHNEERRASLALAVVPFYARSGMPALQLDVVTEDAMTPMLSPVGSRASDSSAAEALLARVTIDDPDALDESLASVSLTAAAATAASSAPHASNSSVSLLAAGTAAGCVTMSSGSSSGAVAGPSSAAAAGLDVPVTGATTTGAVSPGSASRRSSSVAASKIMLLEREIQRRLSGSTSSWAKLGLQMIERGKEWLMSPSAVPRLVGGAEVHTVVQMHAALAQLGGATLLLPLLLVSPTHRLLAVRLLAVLLDSDAPTRTSFAAAHGWDVLSYALRAASDMPVTSDVAAVLLDLLLGTSSLSVAVGVSAVESVAGDGAGSSSSGGGGGGGGGDSERPSVGAETGSRNTTATDPSVAMPGASGAWDPSRLTMRNPACLDTLVQLLPSLAPSLQVHLLGSLYHLVVGSAHNLARWREGPGLFAVLRLMVSSSDDDGQGLRPVLMLFLQQALLSGVSEDEVELLMSFLLCVPDGMAQMQPQTLLDVQAELADMLLGHLLTQTGSVATLLHLLRARFWPVPFGLLESPVDSIRCAGVALIGLVLHDNARARAAFTKAGGSGFATMADSLSAFPVTPALCTALLVLALDQNHPHPEACDEGPGSSSLSRSSSIASLGALSASGTSASHAAAAAAAVAAGGGAGGGASVLASSSSMASALSGGSGSGSRGGGRRSSSVLSTFPRNAAPARQLVHPEALQVMLQVLGARLATPGENVLHVLDLTATFVGDVDRLLQPHNMDVLWEHDWLDWCMELQRRLDALDSDMTSVTTDDSRGSDSSLLELRNQVEARLHSLMRRMLVHDLGKRSVSSVCGRGRLHDMLDSASAMAMVVEDVIDYFVSSPILPDATTCDVFRNLRELYRGACESVSQPPELMLRTVYSINMLSADNLERLRRMMVSERLLELRDMLNLDVLRGEPSVEVLREMQDSYSFDLSGALYLIQRVHRARSDRPVQVAAVTLLRTAHGDGLPHADLARIFAGDTVQVQQRLLGWDGERDISVDEFLDWYFGVGLSRGSPEHQARAALRDAVEAVVTRLLASVDKAQRARRDKAAAKRRKALKSRANALASVAVKRRAAMLETSQRRGDAITQATTRVVQLWQESQQHVMSRDSLGARVMSELQERVRALLCVPPARLTAPWPV